MSTHIMLISVIVSVIEVNYRFQNLFIQLEKQASAPERRNRNINLNNNITFPRVEIEPIASLTVILCAPEPRLATNSNP